MTNAKTGTDALKKGVLAGDDEYTMCISTILGGTLGTIVSDGVLANLCDNEYLSLDKSWWSYLFKKNLSGSTGRCIMRPRYFADDVPDAALPVPEHEARRGLSDGH